MKIVSVLCVLGASFVIQGCTSEIPELKSPCVGIQGSPCGDRTPANENWLNPQAVSYEA